MIQEKFQKHRHSTSPYATPEDLQNRQYQQGQEYKMKPPLVVLQSVLPALRVRNSSSIQPSKVYDLGGRVPSALKGVGRETGAGTGAVATYVAIPVQSRSSSAVGHTIVRAARADYSDGLQKTSGRHASSSGYNINNMGDSDSVSGGNHDDDNEVQMLSAKYPYKRGNIEVSQPANIHSDSMKPPSKEKKNFVGSSKKPKVIFTLLYRVKMLAA